MFRLESYVAPYILGYLGKYINDFRPNDFQVSVWTGDAEFLNLNLNLDAVNAELDLPVTLVSGHIHALRVRVPWTAVTSEPILVNVNTIEMTLKLKEVKEDAPPSPSQSSTSGGADDGTGGASVPGYMQSILTKIIRNVHVTFENVIVKYVEEDIVLSVNVTQASYCTADANWKGAFVDLLPPLCVLRKKFTFSEWTMCLDKTNNAGKIETYHEPLLYKASFELRSYEEYGGPFSKSPRFRRVDVLLNDVHFRVTDEQVPMLIRLYTLIRSLTQVDVWKVPLSGAGGLSLEEQGEVKGEEGVLGEAGAGGVGWGQWAMSLIPPVSYLVGDEVEGDSEEEEEDAEGGAVGRSRESPEEEKEPPTNHYAIRAQEMSFTFCALERVRGVGGRPGGRVHFLPFLRVAFGGVSGDVVFRGLNRSHCVLRYRLVRAEPVGFCPCGVVDASGGALLPYVAIGEEEQKGAESVPTPTLFNSEGRPTYAYETVGTEVPVGGAAVCVEYSWRLDDAVEEPNTIDMSMEKVGVRVSVGPLIANVSSGFLHRLQLITQAAETYAYEPYPSYVTSLLARKRRVRERLPAPMDSLTWKSLEEAHDVYKLSLSSAVIRVSAADHPEYDFLHKTTHKRRRVDHGLLWPYLTFRFSGVVVTAREPCLKYRALVVRYAAAVGSPVPQHIVTWFASTVSGFAAEITLALSAVEGEREVGRRVWRAEEVAFQQSTPLELSLRKEKNIWESTWSSPLVETDVRWVDVLLAVVVWRSTVGRQEALAERLLNTTLLQDFLAPVTAAEEIHLVLKSVSVERVKTEDDAFCERLVIGELRVTHEDVVVLSSSSASTAKVLTLIRELRALTCDKHSVLFARVRPLNARLSAALLRALNYFPKKKAAEFTGQPEREVRAPLLRSTSSLRTETTTDEGIAGLFSSSTATPTARSSRSSSVPAYHLHPHEKNGDAEENFAAGRPPPRHILWENETLSTLQHLQKLAVNILVEPIHITFPIGEDSLEITTPRVSATCDGWNSNDSEDDSEPLEVTPLPVTLNLPESPFPVSICLTNFEVAMALREARREVLLPPTSAILTMSMKDGETTTAYVHADVEKLEVAVSNEAALVLVALAEELSSVGFGGGRLLEVASEEEEEFVGEEEEQRGGGGVVGGGSECRTTILVDEVGEEESVDGGGGASSSVGGDGGGGTNQTKASIWVTLTMGSVGATVGADEGRRLAVSVVDVVSSLDAQKNFSKWTHKVGNVRICMEQLEDSRWTSSDVVLSSSDNLASHLSLGGGDAGVGVGGGGGGRNETEEDGANAVVAAAPSPPTNPEPLSFIVNYTRVLTSSYYKDGQWPSPVAKWNDVVRKYVESGVLPYEDEEARLLTEIDVKMKAVDAVVDIEAWKPFVPLLRRLARLGGQQKSAAMSTPTSTLNSASAPLVYIDTAPLRLFLKSGEDFILVESSSTSVSSHLDNGLSRTMVRPFLYRMAEKARVVSMYGSPVEDRQYGVEVRGLRAATGKWALLQQKERLAAKVERLRATTQTGENAAFLWNSSNFESLENDVPLTPLLEPMEVCIGFAPSIVYQRTLKCCGVLVAGHALEVNVLTDVAVSLSLDQLASLRGVARELAEFSSSVTPPPSPSPPLEEESEETGDNTPIQVLVTSRLVTVKSYEQSGDTCRPLALVIVTQPHLSMSRSAGKNTVEASVFELSLRLPQGGGSERGWIPTPEDYETRVFETMSGVRDPKTGILLPLITLRMEKSSLLEITMSRPLRMELSPELVENLLRLYSLLLPNQDSSISTPSTSTSKTSSPEMELHLQMGQLVLALSVADASLTFTWDSFSWKKKSGDLSMEVSKIALLSRLGEERKKKIVVAPTSVAVKTTAAIRMTFLSVGPTSLHVGAHSLVAAQVVHAAFAKYIPEKKTEDEVKEDVERVEDSFEDDLRIGTFTYERGGEGLPGPYRIAFNEVERTMTWTYPRERALTLVEATPIPMGDAELPHFAHKEVVCRVELWDEAASSFVSFGELTLQESRGSRVSVPSSLYASCGRTWRVKIETPLALADSVWILRPELLAACLRVDSVHDTALLPTSVLSLSCPRILLHWVSDPSYAGKQGSCVTEGELVGATMSVESCQGVARWWRSGKVVAKLNSFVGVSVTDLEFLTRHTLLHPVHIGVHLDGSNEGGRIDVVTKGIDVFVGASALHTLSTCAATATQVLSLWDGHGRLKTAEVDAMSRVIGARVLVLNTLDIQVKLCQADNSDGTFVRGGELSPFVWPRLGGPTGVRVGVRLKEWVYSSSFSLWRSGYVMRQIGSEPLFINVGEVKGAQRVVRVSGSLLLGNALEEDVEVALLKSNRSTESVFRVGARSSPTSFLTPLRQLEFVRFRLRGRPGSSWSYPIHPNDLLSAAKRSIPVPLVEETGGELVVEHVWLTLVEETTEGATRSLLVLSPFFRIRSFLPGPRTGRISTSQQLLTQEDTMTSFLLPGQGSHRHVHFRGELKATHHLHFTANPLGGECSSPTIPLLPGGPVLSMGGGDRAIDELLQLIPEGRRSSLERVAGGVEEVWPFVGEDDEGEEPWGTVAEGTACVVNVDFVEWVDGLPTVLLQVRPSGLLVNLSGRELLFGHDDVDATRIAHHAVFSPINISWDVSRFHVGVDVDGREWWSEWLNVSHEAGRSDVHWSCTDNRVPLGAHAIVTIAVGETSLTCLTLHVRSIHNMVVIAVRPTFVGVNRTTRSHSKLLLQPIVGGLRGPQRDEKWKNVSTTPSALVVPSERATPLPLVLKAEEGKTGEDEPNSASFWVHVGLSLVEGASTPSSTQSPWWWFTELVDLAHIIRTSSCETDVASGVKGFVLGRDGASESVPCLISWTATKGQVWIGVTDDESPHVVIVNRTSEAVVVAESAEGGQVVVGGVWDEQFLHVPSGGTGHLTLSHKFKEFPSLTRRAKLPFLVVGKVDENKKKKQVDVNVDVRRTLLIRGDEVRWSNALRVDEEGTHYLSVGEYVDVKVSLELHGFSSVVYLDPMSSVEVAARDVRKRIGNPSASPREVGSSPRVEAPPALPRHFTAAVVGGERRTLWGVGLFIAGVGLTLTEDVADSSTHTPFLSLLIDDLLVETRPSRGAGDAVVWDVGVSVGRLQVETPSEASELDFPVLLYREDAYTPLRVGGGSSGGLPSLKEAKEARPMMWGGVKWSNAHGVEQLGGGVSAPVCVQVEDALFDCLVPSLLRLSQVGVASWGDRGEEWVDAQSELGLVDVPAEVSRVVDAVGRPWLLRSFAVGEMDVSLSVRLRRPIYLALDHSRLHVGAFGVSSGGVATTSYVVGRSLVSHYTTGVLLQIGNPMRLVGSLELLGSPASLAHSLGAGVADLVLYPYEGMAHGPRGLLAGLGHGLSSLLRNMTSGTLTSVTNWAWSVSRNIDRLTMDEEEGGVADRRVVVSSFSAGLLAGLGAFGIRLLGALGGVAHHPIHSVLAHGPSARGLLGGVGRGVVGVVTRPLGGLVELVALTGEGVLRSAGWTPLVPRRGSLVSQEFSDPSLSRWEWRLRGRVLLAVDALRMEDSLPVVLLVTTTGLTVSDGRSEERTWGVEHVGLERTDDVIVVRTLPRRSPRHVEGWWARARVMEYVRGGRGTGGGPPPHVLVVEDQRTSLRSPTMMSARSEISFGSEVEEEDGGGVGGAEEEEGAVVGTFGGGRSELEELEGLLLWVGRRGGLFRVVEE